MKNRLTRFYGRICHMFTPKVIAVILGVFFILTLLPILYVAPAVRATGDDLGYSYTVHNAILGHEGIIGIAAAIGRMIVEKWYTWQGTWSSIALFCLQPGIWGEAWYPLTVYIALVSILVGAGYCLFVILRHFGFGQSFCWISFFLTAVLLIQYMPYERGGLFWWTSVAHYSIPFGVTMLCVGWSLRWMETGRVRFYVGLVLGMTYLGGAGYPELVLGAVWVFLVIFGSLAGLIGARSRTDKRRSLALLVPLLLLVIGFAFSAMAPGNTVRGGEDFGLNISNVIYTLGACVAEGFTEGIGYFITVRPLIPVLLVVAVFSWEMTKVSDSPFLPDRVWQPILIVLIGFGITCIVRAPAIYAGTEVSGGVPDSYWFITLTTLAICTAGLSSWCRVRHETCRSAGKRTTGTKGTAGFRDTVAEDPADRDGASLCYSPLVLIAAFLLCLALYRHLVGNTVDYTCLQFASSGALSDYEEQMGEWLAILNDPAIENAELPAMNDEQGPFMLMVPTQNSTDYTNTVYELYYNKESVIMVPREE